jgi:hypothetical protein
MLIVLFAQSGPWWDGEINARLLEHVLNRSPVRGPARLLLATLAALGDESGAVDELSTDELCRAAGLANSTYRRARTALLASGEVELVDDGGGRGRMNRWRVLAAAGGLTTPSVRPRRRRAPPPGQPPLLSPMHSEPTPAVASQPLVAGTRAHAEKGPDLSGVSERKGPDANGVTERKGPDASGGSARKRPVPSGVLPAQGPDLSGVSDRNPARNPATQRAHRKRTPQPQNQEPPQPP